MRPLPSRLRAGPFDYTIEEWLPRKAGRVNRLAESDHCELRIRIDTSWPTALCAETLLHEILHVCWHLANLPSTGMEGLQHESQEGIVTAVSMQLGAVLRDNPDVWAWIEEGLRSADRRTVDLQPLTDRAAGG